ncbi:hypothetical protein CQA57_07350, partial [Helicobacter anseris]
MKKSHFKFTKLKNKELIDEKKYFTATGGGDTNNSLNASFSSENSKDSKRFFKPLVASSLALFLTAGVASATCTSTSGAPSICYGVGSTANADQTVTINSGLTWNDPTGGTGLWTLKTGSGQDNPVNITIGFNNNNDEASLSQTLSSDTYSLTIGGNVTDSRKPIFVLQSSKGIDMQSKTLTFDFGKGGNTSKTEGYEKSLKLDLSGVNSSATALKGNLVVNGGRAQQYYGENKFEATFGGDVEGNITIQAGSGGGDVRTDFTFGGNVTGDIIVKNDYNSTSGAPNGIAGGVNNFTFDGGSNKNINITGSIKNESNSSRLNISITNTNEAKIIGQISAHASGQAGNGINTITLSGTTKNLIQDQNRAIESRGATNKIIFEGLNSSIEGEIYGTASAYGDPASNTITFNSTSNNSIIGNIYVTTGATNTINFASGNSNTIQGKIHDSDSTGTTSKNIINFNGNGVAEIKSSDNNTSTAVIVSSIGTNTITLNNTGEQNIIGTIQSISNSYNYNGGSNTISFFGGSSAKISGNVYSSAGKNTITFSSNAKNEIDGMVDANSGNNDIFFGTRPTDSNNAITASGNATSKITHGIYARDGSATIVFATNGDATIGKIESSDEAIRIVDGGANSQVTVDFYGNANNTIDGGIKAQVNAALGTKSTQITFHAGNNNIINGNISSTGYGRIQGVNTINFTNGTTNQLNGSVTAGEGGVNNITFSSTSTNTISGNIQATGGTNTITSTNGFALENSQITSSSGSNSITTNAISGMVSFIGTSGGKNTIEATSSGDLAITQGIYSTVWNDNSNRGNTITLANGDLTIGSFNSNVTDGYGDSNGSSLHAWNSGNGNAIILNKAEATLTLKGNITSDGASNGNTITFGGASGILKSSSGDTISANGKTNINAALLKIQNNSSDIGTLTTTGGTTTLTLTQTNNGGLDGNISTTSGTTKLTFTQDSGTYSVSGIFSTSNAGQNIFDLSTKSATISNDLSFSGSDVTGDGGNIINIGNDKSLTLSDSNSTAKTLTTNSGATEINFLGDSSGSNSSGTFSGNVSTSGGATTFSFTNDNGTYSITGTLSTQGEGQNIFDLST